MVQFSRQDGPCRIVPNRVDGQRQQTQTASLYLYVPVVWNVKLEGQSDCECLDEGAERIVDSDDAEEDAQENDEAVVGYRAPVQGGAFELQVEVARPDEGEHSAREAADEAHQNGKVRDEDGHEHGKDDQYDAQS